MSPEDPKGLAQLSVQDRAEAAVRAEAPLVFYLARVADEIPARKGRERDRALDVFWKTEPYLAGAIYSMCAKVAALDYTLKGPKKSVARYKSMFMSADLGMGWVTFIQKVVLDLLVADNGAFIELLRRKGDGSSAPVRGIAHLDSQRSYRTGNVSIPVKYRSRHDNEYHDLKWYQVIPMADMPSAREEDKGVGNCAVSRVLRAAQVLRDVGLYKRQKLGGKQVPGKIFFVSGIRSGAVKAALNEAYEMQRSEGYTHYTKPVILTAPDPMTPVGVNEIELAGLPDNYNEDDTLKWYITALALAFGTDYTEFAPLPGGTLGSGMQTAEMAARARGKGPGVILQQLEYALNWFILPSTVEFQFSSTDPTAERDRIELRTLRARERSMRIQSGELTAQQARRLAVMEGDAPEELFAEEYQEEIEAGVQEIELIIRSLRDSYDRVEKSLCPVGLLEIGSGL